MRLKRGLLRGVGEARDADDAPRAASQVGGAARHARQRRAHLAAHAEHDDVAVEARERLDDLLGRLAEQRLEVNLVGNRPT